MTIKGGGEDSKQLKKLANKIGNSMVQSNVKKLEDQQCRSVDMYFEKTGELKKIYMKEMFKRLSELNLTDKIETFEELGWSDPDLDPKMGLKKSIDWLR
jgi:hypothetical protein